jgi:hypothetical protein
VERSRLAIADAKLSGLLKTLRSVLGDPRARYFNPDSVFEHFQAYARAAHVLREELPDLMGDLPNRPLPTPSGTSDFGGRGYIERHHLEQLIRDIEYAFEVQSHAGIGVQAQASPFRTEQAVTNLDRIITSGQKEVPEETLLELRIGSRPGTVSIKVKLPGQDGWKLYPDLEIREGVVELPVKLAFLSHAKEDAAFVGDLRQTLLQDGVLTWFDEKDLLPGDDWKREIDRAIESSDYVLVFLSAVSVAKTGYFQREFRYALEQRQLRPEGTRYIIPVAIGDCALPESIRDIHCLRTNEPDWYNRLKRALGV